jgi:hypothetical protein
MGKGGLKDKNVYKLAHMADEELRKWGKAYGVNEKLTREQLLEELVSILIFYASIMLIVDIVEPLRRRNYGS